ncbi:MAG: hypothetical protein GF411_13725 [Candidatus Lokiarchaeota archaeon]|nr:hypothetical protein [Candidatus Lokiarchaeota archaeon]
MLEYRSFPTRKSVIFVMFSPVFAFFIYNISRLSTGTLFSNGTNETLLLGFGALAAIVSILICGQIVDRTKYTYWTLFIGSVSAPALSLVANLLGFPSAYSPILETIVVLFLFSGIGFALLSWMVLLNRTVVLRFRARVVAVFLTITLLLVMTYSWSNANGISLWVGPVPIPELAALVGVIANISIKMWKWKHYPLAVKESPTPYFVAVALLLGSHLLWYFSTRIRIAQLFDSVGDSSYASLVNHAGLGAFELIPLIIGVIAAGYISDIRGRKTAYSIVVLFFGFLAIFGSTFYGLQNGSVRLFSVPLLIWERLVEGFLLGLCLLLVWSEMDTPKEKGRRLSYVWIFFLGYMSLFWALSLGVPFGEPPQIIGAVGTEFAIFLSLIGLYRTGHLPVLYGREMEMEDFELGFDEGQVRETVEAYLGDEDVASIRHQLVIMDAADDMSDKELSDILGEDIREVLPLTRVKGIGKALEKKLIEAGYKSAAQLAGETAPRLAEKVPGISIKKAEKILKNAREISKSALSKE